MLLNDDFTRHLPGPKGGGDSETRRSAITNQMMPAIKLCRGCRARRRITSKSCLPGRMIATGVKIRITPSAEDQALVRRGRPAAIDGTRHGIGGKHAMVSRRWPWPRSSSGLRFHGPEHASAGGVAATREITHLVPGTQLLVLTTLQR